MSDTSEMAKHLGNVLREKKPLSEQNQEILRMVLESGPAGGPALLAAALSHPTKHESSPKNGETL